MGEQAQLARVNQICTLKLDTVWCFWMCRCSDHLLLFHSFLASIFCGIWHNDYTSVQSFCAPLSIFLVSNRVAWSSPPSGFLWLVLLCADTVLTCSPVHQSPACGIGEHRKAPPCQMSVKTLFHPVLSLSFLVSYEHLTLRSVAALSFPSVLARFCKINASGRDGKHEPRFIQ